VSQTLDRSTLYAIETPQIFNYSKLVYAYQQAYREDYRGTDDASLYERYIDKVKVVEGDYSNLKITTPGDLILAEALLKSNRDEGR